MNLPFQISKDLVSVPDRGLVMMDTMLVLHDADKHVPEKTTACWLVLETPENELCWEFGEYRVGAQGCAAGWYLVGSLSPIQEIDYTVRFFCYEPCLVSLSELVARA